MSTSMSGRARDDQRSAIGRFGKLTDEHPSVGKPCVICTAPMEVGDTPSLIALAPASAEDNAKWERGSAYNAVSGIAHEHCAWPTT